MERRWTSLWWLSVPVVLGAVAVVANLGCFYGGPSCIEGTPPEQCVGFSMCGFISTPYGPWVAAACAVLSIPAIVLAVRGVRRGTRPAA